MKKKTQFLQEANRMSDCQVIVTAQEGYLRNALERGTDDAQMRSARKEDNPHKIIILRQRFSTESSSSRASFTSSSRSSSLSSLLEQGSPVKAVFSETVSGEGNKSFHVRRQSLDLQEFVKDSMEAQISSTEVETAQVRDTFIVSAVDAMNLSSLKQSSAGINEHEGVYRSSSAVSRNASYNGRELNRASYDSKLQDYPRLYLGCKKTDLNSSFDDSIQTIQGNKGRAPSVVAKLMGLEALPSSASSSGINMGSSSSSYEDKDIVRISSSFKLSPAKNSWKERSSPPWKIHDGTAKPSSLFPIEPAPWKNVEKPRILQKVAPRSSNSLTKVAYSEIEKRLKDLEFLVSGKNLGETKQTIEAVEVEVLPENAKGGHGSNFRIHEEETKQQQLNGSVRSFENQVVSSKSDVGTSTNEESPIVIKKPAKCVSFSNESPIDNRDCSNSGAAGKEQNLGNGEIVLTVNSVRVKNDPTTKTSMKPQQMSKDGGGTGPGKKISGSITSSRMQQKKLDIVEKRSVKSEIQSNKKQSEPKSSVGRRRLKNFQTSDEKLSESSVDSSNSCETSVRCSRNGSPINSRRTSSTGSVKSTRVDAPESLPSGLVKKKLNLMLKEDESAEHFAYSSPVSVLDSNNKNKDSLSSPRQYVRKIAGGTSKCKDGNSELAQRSSESSLVSTSSELGSVFGINRKKLKDIDSLVQKLRSLNSDHDETRVDYIASLCESSNQDHRYVSEILLASGLLLRDFTSTATDYQFHSSECPLNPKLFLVLERTRASSLSEQEGRGKKTVRLTAVDKVDRKLIFDTVNEILARKFVGSSSNPCPLKLTRSSLTARKLLKELCSDIEELQNRSTKCSSKEDGAEWKTILFDDVMHHSEKWIDFDTEISGAVLDIERLIFKDLVKEIVVGGEISASTFAK